MKSKILFYNALRVVLGVLLAFHALLNVFNLEKFLIQMDVFFGKADFFGMIIIQLLTPLVPFLEFTLGSLLVIGYFTRNVLLASFLLFGIVSVVFYIEPLGNLMEVHLLFMGVTAILWFYNKYDFRVSRQRNFL